MGFNYLRQIRNLTSSIPLQNYWLSVHDNVGIILSEEPDSLVWGWNESEGKVTAKLAYEAISSANYMIIAKWLFLKLWKWNLLDKLKCFMWICLALWVLVHSPYLNTKSLIP